VQFKILKMRRVWLTLAFLLLIGGIIAYTYLGGFEEPRITIKETPSFTIVGYPYLGKMNVKVFGATFDKADSLLHNKILKGYEAAYFYNQPKGPKEELKAFIGILAKDTSLVSLEKRVFPSAKVVEAVINMHYLIIPINIYPKIQKFAEKNKLKLSPESVEIYASNKKLIVQVPIIGKE